jgi:hypothetical protein
MSEPRMTKTRARLIVRRLANATGDQIIPTEDLIDLAQALDLLFQILDASGSLDEVPFKP